MESGEGTCICIARVFSCHCIWVLKIHPGLKAFLQILKVQHTFHRVEIIIMFRKVKNIYQVMNPDGYSSPP